MTVSGARASTSTGVYTQETFEELPHKRLSLEARFLARDAHGRWLTGPDTGRRLLRTWSNHPASTRKDQNRDHQATVIVVLAEVVDMRFQVTW